MHKLGPYVQNWAGCAQIGTISGTLITSLVLSGCAVFSVLGISNTDGVVAFSCVFAGVSVSAWNALDVWIVELFPTHVRSTAFGIQVIKNNI